MTEMTNKLFYKKDCTTMKKLLLILALFFTAPLAYAQEPEIVVNAKIRITLKDGQRFESYCGNNEKLYQSIVAGLADTNKTYMMIPMVDKKETLLGYTTFLKSEVTSASYIHVFGKVEPGDIGHLEKLLEGDIKIPPALTPDKDKGNNPGPPEPEDKETK